jgi:hypothetical protein
VPAPDLKKHHGTDWFSKIHRASGRFFEKTAPDTGF